MNCSAAGVGAASASAAAAAATRQSDAKDLMDSSGTKTICERPLSIVADVYDRSRAGGLTGL
jgi:hypothetical protein